MVTREQWLTRTEWTAIEVSVDRLVSNVARQIVHGLNACYVVAVNVQLEHKAFNECLYTLFTYTVSGNVMDTTERKVSFNFTVELNAEETGKARHNIEPDRVVEITVIEVTGIHYEYTAIWEGLRDLARAIAGGQCVNVTQQLMLEEG
jgi:hypothetical protein